jgi:hypothetical protein
MSRKLRTRQSEEYEIERVTGKAVNGMRRDEHCVVEDIAK